MTVASASRERVSIVKETTAGVTPANPVFQVMRKKDCSLAVSRSELESNEAREDRQVADMRLGNTQVGGDITFELSYESFDDQLAALLGGEWSAAIDVSLSTIDADDTDNSFNLSAGDFLADGFIVGQSVTISGFTETANNGTFTIQSLTSDKMVVAGGTLVAEAEGDTVQLTTKSTLKAGTRRSEYTIERHFQDIDRYLRYRGCEFNTMSLTIAPDAMIEGSFGIVGLDQDTPSSTPLAGATYLPRTTTSPMDSFTGALLEDGVPLSSVTNISLEINNGIEPLFVVGQKGAACTGIGKFAVTATITSFFENTDLLEKFLTETESTLQFDASANGQTYRFILPRIKYVSGQPDTSGDEDITVELGVRALIDADSKTTITIEKV